MSETPPEETVQFETPPEETVQFETPPEETVQFETPAPVPDVITLEDIQNEQSVLMQNEINFKDFLTRNILNVPLANVRPRLIQWANLQYPDGYTIINVPITVPQTCSDGTTRSARDYIEFCLGMSISEVMSTLSSRITGVVLTYRITQPLFEIIVLKA